MKVTAIGRKRFAALGVVAASVAFLIGAAPASATLTVLITTGDTYTASANPTNNYGAGAMLRAGHNGTTGNLRTLVKFDLPDTPPGCQTVVNQALFYGQFLSGVYAPANDWWAPAADGWAEGTVTWNNQPGVVTSAEVQTSGSPVYGANVTEPVQYLYDEGHKNRGLVLRSKATGSVNDVLVQASNEGNSEVPKLSFMYTVVC